MTLSLLLVNKYKKHTQIHTADKVWCQHRCCVWPHLRQLLQPPVPGGGVVAARPDRQLVARRLVAQLTRGRADRLLRLGPGVEAQGLRPAVGDPAQGRVEAAAVEAEQGVVAAGAVVAAGEGAARVVPGAVLDAGGQPQVLLVRVRPGPRLPRT